VDRPAEQTSRHKLTLTWSVFFRSNKSDSYLESPVVCSSWTHPKSHQLGKYPTHQTRKSGDRCQEASFSEGPGAELCRKENSSELRSRCSWDWQRRVLVVSRVQPWPVYLPDSCLYSAAALLGGQNHTTVESLHIWRESWSWLSPPVC